MSMSEQKENQAPADLQSAPDRKKPYERPAFQHERVFERMALSCGKIDSTEEQCSIQASSS